MRSLVFALCIVAVAAVPLETLNEERFGAPPNLTEIVRLYMNFGAVSGSPTHYNCSTWARLWNEDGIRNTPGEPPSRGWPSLEYMCELVRGQFSALYCDSQIEIDVVSYNAEKRTAFTWTINGILASTGEQVNVPVISTLFMDKDGTIQNAWDFLDPSPLQSQSRLVSRVDDPVNVTEVVRTYMNFGGFNNYPHAANCSKWASLFGDVGIRNVPGTPPTRGYQNFLKLCQDVRGQFETMLNFAELTISATSWNTERRVAFLWGIEGMLTTGKVVHVQAISALFLFKNGTIQYAWDFLDPSAIEP